MKLRDINRSFNPLSIALLTLWELQIMWLMWGILTHRCFVTPLSWPDKTGAPSLEKDTIFEDWASAFSDNLESPLRGSGVIDELQIFWTFQTFFQIVCMVQSPVYGQSDFYTYNYHFWFAEGRKAKNTVNFAIMPA